ncbi:cell division protein ZapE [Gordonia sp. VNK1]|uniref:cell division protein ZapE n=1 Tax=Gordonia oleivorans TaxID=3156618 RepID=UPI0032B53CA6
MFDLRRRRAPIPRIGLEVFEFASRRDGFALDASQIRAALELTGDAGLYLVGPPGSGKTWLMDTYVTALAPKSPRRVHWHEFVATLHVLIRDHGGIDGAIHHLLAGVAVLCFDEVHIHDRADGIFLHRLMQQASDIGVRLIFTSNTHPDDLMPHPLFHHEFLPTIDLIHTTCRTIEFDTGVDYRQFARHATGFASGRWLVASSTPDRHERARVTVRGRALATIGSAESGSVTADFGEICGRPFGAIDYLELVQRHDTWMVTGVPTLASAGREPAQRFVHLVDVLYDHDCPLTIVSPVDLSHVGAGAPRAVTGVPRLLSRLSALRT